MVNLNRGYRTITKRPFDLQQFNSDRDEALLSLDKEKIQTFQKKYNIGFQPSSERVFWAAVHKAILVLNAATEEQKMRSKKWLKSHGFSPHF